MGPCSTKLLGSSQGESGTPITGWQGDGRGEGVPTRVPTSSAASPLPGPRAKGDKPPAKEPRGKAKAHPPEPPQQEHDFLGCMSK